jgi:hypothetical protein
MIITRRAFIAGVSAALTLPIVDRFTSYLENFGEPLIEAPKRPDRVLYVVPEWYYEIGLDRKPGDLSFLPKVPLREALRIVYGWDTPSEDDLESLESGCGIECTNLDALIDDKFWWAHMDWVSQVGSEADAYHFLEGLGIGPKLLHGEEVGGLTFEDGPNPGCDYIGVTADDDISVSLLQHELNATGANVAVRIVEA